MSAGRYTDTHRLKVTSITYFYIHVKIHVAHVSHYFLALSFHKCMGRDLLQYHPFHVIEYVFAGVSGMGASRSWKYIDWKILNFISLLINVLLLYLFHLHISQMANSTVTLIVLSWPKCKSERIFCSVFLGSTLEQLFEIWGTDYILFSYLAARWQVHHHDACEWIFYDI